jgi:hypothetical protein
VQVSVVRFCPPVAGDCPSFYRPRRKQFTSVPHCSNYVWRHGVQCHGVDGRPGESCFWQGVTVRPVRAHEQLRGWRRRGCPFEGRPREDSRVPLTWGRTRHSGWSGGVLSPYASTASGTGMQWPGWRRGGGDGRTGPMATEVTAPTSLTSRHSPVRAWSSRPPPPFEGSAVLFQGCGALAVREWVVQCHGVVADHAAQCGTTAGMASLGERAEQCRGVILRRVVAWIRL